MKVCCRCRVAKPESEFVKAPRRPDGLESYCKPCDRARRKEQYDPAGKAAHYQANRAEVRAQQAKHYQDHKPERRKRGRTEYKRRRAHILDQKREYYRANRKAIQEKARRKRVERRGLLNNLKSAPCQDCGGSFPPCCMDFHHRPGTKKVAGVAQLFAGSLKRLHDEIAKCDLICKVCHRVRTADFRALRRTRNRALEERLAYLNQAKSNPCSQCGGSFPIAAMDFHHHGRKERGVARVARTGTLEKLQREIAQCTLLCANCHAAHHYA